VTNQRIDLTAAAQMIQSAERILFFLHVSPDGDSIGSTLGMVHALRAAGRQAIIVGVDAVPRIYQFLSGWDTLFVPWQEVEGEWDLACFLDCGDMERVGDALPVVTRAKRTLNIDHHATNTVYGEYNYLDFSAAAVGELAYLLLREMGLPIDQSIATCLYTSIVADTGSFRYDSTAPSTHRIAAELISAGAEPYEVATALFESESQSRLALLSHALSTLQVDPGGQIAWMHVTRAMLKQAGALEQEAEGLVNYARSITGVEVGILFRERADGQIRVGLRSRKRVDVGQIAVAFGGGGHARAAGCGLMCSLADAQSQVIEAVKVALS
jgi:phosphoesterase RecJ-like protein